MADIPKKPRYDWYQTDSHVIIAVMLKNINFDDINTKFGSRSLDICVRQNQEEHQLNLNLNQVIVPEKCSYKVGKVKIEFKLCKGSGLFWRSLEDASDDSMPTPSAHSVTDTNTHQYPTSAHVTRDWDAVAKDAVEEEKKDMQGEAALNKMFQDIYSNATEETRRAMNKSFQESGGTVLSTNWDEIGKEKTEIKPPDGMEYRKWNE